MVEHGAAQSSHEMKNGVTLTAMDFTSVNTCMDHSLVSIYLCSVSMPWLHGLRAAAMHQLSPQLNCASFCSKAILVCIPRSLC